MSWLQRLHETYVNLEGREPDKSAKLTPTCHTTQKVQIEVVLNASGAFRRAMVVEKDQQETLIPCTEASAVRSGKTPASHPLTDKLQYLAGDFVRFGGEVTSGFAKDPAKPHRDYVQALSDWAATHPHPKLTAILNYVRRGTLVSDLTKAGILHADPSTQKLLPKWTGDKTKASPIFKVLQTGSDQGDTFVRWRVELGDVQNSATWSDDALISSWITHHQSGLTKTGYCMVTGEKTVLATQYPARLLRARHMAKLISANDTAGYTFRGKFDSADEALGLGYVVTQKAHNALRWLIAHQGHESGHQAYVAWETTGKPIPDPCCATFEYLGLTNARDAEPSTGTGEAFALALKKCIEGYKAKLSPRDEVVVMGLDSATTGRMAITLYREIKGSDFLARIEAWHKAFAWRQDYDKDCKFTGAPALKDIAEAVFGRWDATKKRTEVDSKVSNATIERLLPCIVDGQPLPIDLLRSAVRQASNRAGKDHQAWEKCLGIACSLFKGFFKEREYLMALEHERTSRDYLFGRLLAIAENLESYALYVADEKSRDTSAARLMQRFADRPASTWRTIALNLRPYISRLRSRRPGVLHKKETLLDEVTCKFNPDDFRNDKPLSGEFLLGYHCQRRAMRPPEQEAADEPSTTTQATTSGESA